jgi:predicted protein tyrosine phosphatase
LSLSLCSLVFAQLPMSCVVHSDSGAEPVAIVMSIYVCNLIEMPGHAEALGVSHLVSLVAPTEQPPTPSGIADHRHHRVEIHDISEPLDGHILPASEHLAGLITFLRAWPHDDAPILIHCVAGISRSMAAALITLAIKAPGRELEAARHVRSAARHAYPNRRMVAVADELLGCNGRLIAAREAMGPADLLPLGPLVHLPLLR